MGTEDNAPGPGIGALGQGGCTGLGKNGSLQLFGAPVTEVPFIKDTALPDGSRDRNYTGALGDVFKTMARAGAGGCGFEQHLQAVQRALDPGNPANGGFLRPDAYLAVVIITDEDDCSLRHSSLLARDETVLGALQSFRCTRFGIVCDEGGETPDAMNAVGPKGKCHPDDASPYLTKVSDHAAFLKGLKAEPDNIVVAGIMGVTDPVGVELRMVQGIPAPIPALDHSCTYIGGNAMAEVADPPIRLQAFLDEFPRHSAFAPICQRDLSGGLQLVAELLKERILGNPCLNGALADVDPKTPGPQYSCDVSAVIGRDTPAQAEITVPRCVPGDASATNPPCWHLATDPGKCPNGDHVTVAIEGMTLLPSAARVLVTCATEPPR
jgi:hypothetical protein